MNNWVVRGGIVKTPSPVSSNVNWASTLHLRAQVIEEALDSLGSMSITGLEYYFSSTQP